MTIGTDALLTSLSGPEWESTWHALVESGPNVQLVTEAFSHASADVQILLLKALREWRVPESISLAARALESNNAEVWKEALDVLVTIGDEVAVACLRDSLDRASGLKREWLT